MAVHRYAAIDAEGFKINTILIEESAAGKNYPGYGAKLIDEDEQPEEPKAPLPPPRPDDFGVLDVKLDAPMEVGDRIDFKTGEVTKRPEPKPGNVAEIAAEVAVLGKI